MEKTMVMFDSTEAAEFRTNLSGWVSRTGRYFGQDERSARYDGCTHIHCENCGKPVERGWLICPECRTTKEKAQYAEMPKRVWNQEGMIYSMSADRYFSSWEEVEYFLDDEGGTEDALMLVICEPNFLPFLDERDFGCDSLAEDGELPDNVKQAIDAFNEVIKTTGPVSWSPGRVAATK